MVRAFALVRQAIAPVPECVTKPNIREEETGLEELRPSGRVAVRQPKLDWAVGNVSRGIWDKRIR